METPVTAPIELSQVQYAIEDARTALSAAFPPLETLFTVLTSHLTQLHERQTQCEQAHQQTRERLEEISRHVGMTVATGNAMRHIKTEPLLETVVKDDTESIPGSIDYCPQPEVEFALLQSPSSPNTPSSACYAASGLKVANDSLQNSCVTPAASSKKSRGKKRSKRKKKKSSAASREKEIGEDWSTLGKPQGGTEAVRPKKRRKTSETKREQASPSSNLKRVKSTASCTLGSKSESQALGTSEEPKSLEDETGTKKDVECAEVLTKEVDGDDDSQDAHERMTSRSFRHHEENTQSSMPDAPWNFLFPEQQVQWPHIHRASASRIDKEKLQ